ncbi:MAG: ribonuclease E/G, partial [Deltaproteobacteria bacterium]|nr:ribonuclease E/G [Deltaproteobacteria bacterium]
GLIVIDYIDMMDRKNNAEVERTFKKALSLDRARIQLAKISKFGIMELSRQKKHSTIQEISYIPCPFCQGSGIRPSVEYAALSAFRKMESQAVKGASASLTVSLPHEVAHYLLNQKRSEICKLETDYEMDIHIVTVTNMAWDTVTIEATTRKPILGAQEARLKSLSGREESQEIETEEGDEEDIYSEVPDDQEQTTPAAEAPSPAPAEEAAVPRKKSRHRRRNRHRKPASVPGEVPATVDGGVVLTSLPAQVVKEGAVAAEKTTGLETVAAVTPADPVAGPRRPAARRRRKKTAHPPFIPDVAIPAPEREVKQETATAISPAEPTPAPRVKPPRNPRKKKSAVRPVAAPDAAAPEPVLSQETAAESTTHPAPPRAKRRPYARRRPNKKTDAPSSEGENLP